MPVVTSSAQDAETRAQLAGPAIRAFFRITDSWGLTDQQRLVLLGESVARSTLQTWKDSTPRTLSVDQIERCSYVVAIYEGLMRVFRRAPELSVRWLELPRAEHPFYGKSALAFMLNGRSADLAAVRALVDHVNGGPPSRAEYPTPPREA
ncbi:antitoxin Xre-like helix-turn-helix domain-containing protein [Gemmatimonas sp.]|uniref:antitoxin Xre-like helix-turn-helix domain-containing protein n=1 Tax=Gemmatimonas sp. TaxID=1962908 RepID=UPI00286DCCCE|nr:antitoxin Xre-like helix-turn-helix domain-containing protein [Gemmatimonas sp.]